LLYSITSAIVKISRQIKELHMKTDSGYMLKEMFTLLGVLAVVGGACLLIITVIQ
jgi:hypothetical protein